MQEGDGGHLTAVGGHSDVSDSKGTRQERECQNRGEGGEEPQNYGAQGCLCCCEGL